MSEDGSGVPQSGFRQILRQIGAAGIDDNRGLDIGERVIDTRFESTFDIMRQSVLDVNTPAIFGRSDTVKAIVLRSENAPFSPFGMMSENMLVRARVIDNYHSELLMDPVGVEGLNPLDVALVSSFPAFRYSAMDEAGVIPPGSVIRATFDAGSLSKGVVQAILMPPGGDFVAMGGSGSMGPMGGGMGAFRMMGGAGGPYTKGVDMYDYKKRLVPTTREGCEKAGFKAQKNILNEEIVTSTIVPNYKGNFSCKLKVSVMKKLEKAYLSLQAQGIDLSVGDTLRSFEGQRKAYMTKGQPGQKKAKMVAHPCSGYHPTGQAVDVNQSHRVDLLAHGPIYQALWDSGLQRINWEYWHWSVGETSRKPRDNVFKAGCKSSPADTFTV